MSRCLTENPRRRNERWRLNYSKIDVFRVMVMEKCDFLPIYFNSKHLVYNLFTFRASQDHRQDESADSDPKSAQDEREGVGGRGGGDQELLALRVQGLGLGLPWRAALRDDGGGRHLHVLTVRGAGECSVIIDSLCSH